jgi:hypothetical protein
MKFKLPDIIASPQDVTSLFFEIKDYSKWFLHESIKVESSIKKVVKSPEMSPGAKELLHDWSTKNPITRTSLDELISILEKYTSEAPVMTIVLAAPATNDIKSKLVGWCRNNLAKNMLVNFSFNTSLLGGMVIRIGSHIYDWSFRRQLLDNKSKFPEVLRNV